MQMVEPRSHCCHNGVIQSLCSPMSEAKNLPGLTDFINKQFSAGFFSRNSCIVENKVVAGALVNAVVKRGHNGELYFLCGEKVTENGNDYEAILQFLDSSELPPSCIFPGWKTSQSACSTVAQRSCQKALSIRSAMYKAL